MTQPAGRVLHRGGCHCGAVRFEVEAPAEIDVLECTCSICRMTGYRHLIVPAARFRLLRGREVLRSYRFHTRTAEHLFCEVCGIKSFYRPRSHPEGVSVNVRCLDPGTVVGERVRVFDGAHWERAAGELPGLEEAEDEVALPRVAGTESGPVGSERGRGPGSAAEAGDPERR